MENEKQVKPFLSLLFLGTVMGILLLIMVFFPENGIKIGGSTLKFPAISEFFAPNTSYLDSLEQRQRDLQILFDSTDLPIAIDSALIQKKLDSLLVIRKSIQVPESAQPDLIRFFNALDRARSRKVRVMHYGDSQIEGDRITGHLRNELQTRFGGSGPGLFDVMQVAPKPSINIEYSENWLRFSGFGWMDSTVNHNRYGPLMAFSRYLPIPDTTRILDTLIKQAWITLRPAVASYAKTKNYNTIKVFLSNLYAPMTYEIEANGTQLEQGNVSANNALTILQANLETTPEILTIRFSGTDSPDVYGISLESTTGVIVDNIPLRGSSGTLFAKHNLELLSQSYKHLSPDLIILEFGGNVLPYIENEEECLEYGEWFKAQIKMLRRLNPNSAFLIIGPADASVKVKTDYITHPFLETVRDVMLQAAKDTGCMYWDMYEVMGGKNSMPQWVGAKPPLAAPDYIHFSRLGAQKMAEIFVEKLFGLYESYKQPQAIVPSAGIQNLKNDVH